MGKEKLLDKIGKRIFHGIRYDVPKREMRHFNDTGLEKNPNRVRFYSLNEDAANRYKTLYNEDGFELDIPTKRTDVFLDGNYFDMQKNFRNLDTYKRWLEKQKLDSDEGFNLARGRAEKEFKNKPRLLKKRLNFLDEMKKEDDANFVNQKNTILKGNDFQFLSDYDYQDFLAKELKENGFDGYYVDDKEIAVFPWSNDYPKKYNK